jgi:hypothetical protein
MAGSSEETMPSKTGGRTKTEGVPRKRRAPEPVRQEPVALREQPTLTIGVQRAIQEPGEARPRDILALQRMAGNRAVTGLIQAKLTVGGAGDRYEQEADRVAEQVLRMGNWATGRMGEQSGPGVQRQEEEVQAKPLAASITPIVQRQEEEEEVQTKPLVQRQEEEEEELQTKPLVQRQEEEEEEELQTKPLVQRQEEEEEELQTKPLVQRQEEEEEELQTKPLVQRQEEEEELQTKPLVQRQEEEEELQTKPLVQRQEEEEELQTKPLVQRQEEEEELQTKPLIQRQEEEEEIQTKPLLQRQEDGSFQASSQLESRLAAQKGRGSPLPNDVRASVEPRFGADFSQVRVHTGGEATKLNQELNSRAFTHGKDIYFKGGEFSSKTLSGQKLLAHELTHTIQQGAASRIQGWWPKGHRLVTELAIKEGGFGKFYDEEARQYLIDRSPDVDFIQDEFDTMNQGIEESKARLDLYEFLVTSGNAPEARKMYWNNELHMRRPAYMLSHGEGGLYKEENAAAKNEAMTRTLVAGAAGMWRWDDFSTWADSLSVLSDALHQAEDRGSHGEGNAFTGHDVRILRNKFDWEKEGQKLFEAKSGGIPPSKWEPDNVAVNQQGAVLAVGFAQQALEQFRAALDAKENRPISLSGIKKLPAKRKLKAKKALPKTTSSEWKARVKGSTGGGRETLRKVFDETKKTMSEAYETARTGLKGEEAELPEGFLPLLADGFRFYTSGAGLEAVGLPEPQQQQAGEAAVMAEVFLAAKKQFQQWAKARWRKGGKSKSNRIDQAKTYYQQEVAKGTTDREKEVRGKAVQAAYYAVFRERLAL